MGAGADFAGSLLGMTETAYLVVLDKRAQRLPPEAPNVQEGLAGELAEQAGNLANATRRAKAATKNVVSGALATLTGRGAPKAAAGIAGTNAVSKYFKVQFNPSELVVNTSEAVLSEANLQNSPNGGSGADGVATGTSGHGVLSVNLYFDKMNKADAFSADKFNLSASGIASNITTAVLASVGSEWTVQPQVEALTAALRNEATRQVSFYWSDFSFTGSLESLSAQYTMFSLSGKPIRAKVSLRINQLIDNTLMADWYRDFDSMFESSNTLSSIGQKVGGLLNLNL